MLMVNNTIKRHPNILGKKALLYQQQNKAQKVFFIYPQVLRIDMIYKFNRRQNLKS